MCPLQENPPEHVVVEAVVAGQGDETAPTVGQGEEYLNGSVVPNLDKPNAHLL